MHPWRHIGGGYWDGEEVTIEINDETGEIQMIYCGEWEIDSIRRKT